MLRAVCLLLLLIILNPTFGWAGGKQLWQARVSHVLTAKTLQLDDGSIIRLAAIQAPNRARNAQEKDEPLAAQAFSTLETLAKGKEVTIKPVSKTPDRKGRIVAEVFVQGESLQEAMLRAGMAWVYSFPDTRKFASRFLKAEEEAEAAKRGVWSISDYAVLGDAEAHAHEGQFRLVEGVPVAVAIKKGKRSYINFGNDWKTDFTLFIEPADLKRFDEAWLQSLTGKRVRVRGWLFASGGAAMELTHPEQVELLQ